VETPAVVEATLEDARCRRETGRAAGSRCGEERISLVEERWWSAWGMDLVVREVSEGGA